MADVLREIPGAVGPLEALLDEPAGAPPRRRRLRAPASAARRDDAHEGGVPGREGAGADRLRGAAVQLPRRRRERGHVRRGRGEKADFRAALDYMAARYPGLPLWAAGFSFGSWVALRSARRRSASAALIGIAPPVTTIGYDFPNTLASTKPKFFVQGEADEVCPLEGDVEFYGQLQEPKELVVIDGADHLFDGQDQEVGEALEDLLAGLLTMQEAVIVSAVRTPVGKAPNGALRDRAARRAGGDCRSRRRCARAGARSGGDRRRDPRLRDAGGRAGAERRAHRQPARRRAGLGVGGHRQPLLLVGAAGDRLRRRADHGRLRRRRSSPAAPSR